jgi:general secretion pathway protein G
MKKSPLHRHRHSGGYTLVEIMIVLTIIAILAGAAIFGLVGTTDTARIQRVSTDIQTIKTALQAYELLAGNLPSNDQGLRALVARPTGEPQPRSWTKQMEDSAILDPWNHPYFYRYPGQKNAGSYDLYSAGPDGLENTEDDIGNWK